MSSIFKIYLNNYNNSSVITDLFLFIKNDIFEYDINEYNNKYSDGKVFIKSSIFNYFDSIFNDLDKKYINDFDIKIHFIDDNILLDDTIQNIKFKFIKYYKNIKPISFEELYLYSQTINKYDPVFIYNLLSNHNTIKITEENLKIHLLNINEQNYIYNKLKNDSSIYTYDDFDNIDLDNIHIFKPLGITLYTKINNLYLTNPFLYNNYYNSIIKNTSDTNNNSLLFEHNINNDTIYICLYEDVYSYLKKNITINEEYLLQSYFPYLYENKIISNNLYIKYNKQLIDKTNKYIESDNFINKNNTMEFLYNIYTNKNYKLNYLNDGIDYIHFMIHTKINKQLSIESIFKLINSNFNIPFIKYNPGSKIENIYRLYTNKIATNNQKIPFLQKTDILKYAKFGKINTITYVFNNNLSDIPNIIKLFVIELNQDGIFTIKVQLNNYIPIEKFNYILTYNINYLFNILLNNIEKDYELLQPFNSLIDKNVEIINLNYNIQLENNDFLTFKPIYNILSYIFNIISDDITNKELLYKRVSSYNEASDIEAFIINMAKLKESPNTMINLLIENFKIKNIEEAKEHIENTLSSIQYVINSSNLNKLKIKNSTGFPIIIDNYKDVINISIKKIDNINYLFFISLYFDAIFKILFYNIDIPFIKQNSNKKTKEINDITNVTDNIKNDVNNMLDTEIKLNNDDDVSDTSETSNDILNILLDDDDDDIDENMNNEDNDDDEKNITENKIKSDKILENDEDKDEDEIDLDLDLDEIIINNDDNDDYKKVIENIEKKEPQTLKKKFIESKSNNPILNKLEKLQPKIFDTKIYKPKVKLTKQDENANFDSYSRLCQSERQPVILTKEEKEILLNEYPDYKDDLLEYSSNPKENYYYICPKFWDIDKNILLTQEQVDSGKYGTLFHKTKNKSGNIYKFSNKDRYTGFLKDKVKDTDGNEYCLPCCYLKIKGKINKKYKECDTENKEILPKTTDNDLKYVIKHDKFPLDQYKIGHLPLNVQKLLQFDTNSCISKDNNNLKYKYTCILRYGVEKNDKNSFIACIADLYSKLILKKNKTISINEMKKIIENAINIDNFILYNNGNLTHIFLSKNINFDNISIDKYKSELLNKLDKSNVNQINMYKKIISAYENFKYFINNDNYFIDYTYLWDIVCKPNEKLFPEGINMIILDITSFDITDNIKIICPKQNYSNEFIDNNKKTLILIKKNNYFEPIYSVRSEITNIIKPLFSFKQEPGEAKLDDFKKVLNIIKNNINENCTITQNTDNYNFYRNVNLSIAIRILNKLKYEILFQILDYENNIIGVIVQNNKVSGFIPVYPSAIDNEENIPIKMIDDIIDEYYNNYNDTKDILEFIYTNSNNIIKCKPLYKIVENNLTIGIITNGNQFVLLKKPELYINDDLEIISEKNYLINDTYIQTNYTKDNDRIKLLHDIHLESGFYKSFRTTILKLLSGYKNMKFKNKLEIIIKNNSMLYEEKIKNIYNDLMHLSKDYIEFAEYPIELIENIKDVNICMNSENCNTDFCMINEKTNLCNLIIPKYNLLTGDENENIYYTKLADEFIRYNRTKSMFYNNTKHLIYQNIRYKLSDNEILIIESNLLKDILQKKLTEKIPFINNTYDTYNTSETFKNILDLQYEPHKETIQISLNKEENEKYEKLKQLSNKTNNDIEEFLLSTISDCPFKKHTVIENITNFFIDKLYEFYYEINNKSCSYELILTIIHNYYKINNKDYSNININTLKEILIEYYSKHEFAEALITLNHKYNKNERIKIFLEQIKKNKNIIVGDEYYNKYNDMISSIINNNDYVLGLYDLYLLSIHYDLPIILISTSIIDISIHSEKFIILNKNTKYPFYYFIKIPSQNFRPQKTTDGEKEEKNYKLLYFINKVFFNITSDIQNTDNYIFKDKINEHHTNFEDLIIKQLQNYNNTYVIPKYKLKK